jgi:hypothetical protein
MTAIGNILGFLIGIFAVRNMNFSN